MTWQENQTKHCHDSDLLILIETFMYGKDPQNKRPKLEQRRITKWTAKTYTDKVITSLWGITKISSPNCWMARSALQGSSNVMCTRRFWFNARRSACSEIPELAASEMMATSCGNQIKTSHYLWKYITPSNLLLKSNCTFKPSLEIKSYLQTLSEIKSHLHMTLKKWKTWKLLLKSTREASTIL